MLDLITAVEELTLDSTIESVQKALLNYLKESSRLTFTDPETIHRAQLALGRAMIMWAYRFSPVYTELIDESVLNHADCLDRVVGKFFMSKNDLMDQSQWYTPNLESSDTKTSGSTGSAFRYQIWNPAYTEIEKKSHYYAILEEFDIKQPRVLHLVSGLHVPGSPTIQVGDANIRIASKHLIKNYIQRIHCSHGSDNAEFWHIDFNEQAFLHIKDFCGYVVKFIKDNKVNVILASGGFFELLMTYLINDDTNTFTHLAALLSNTGDRVNIDTLEFLVETGVADSYCDHMRCWDGGVGFFTCKHGTYHLTEELSYAFCHEGQLASVDFFNLSSPFINYLNGDFAQIENNWEKCECGRWHRPFKFLNRRSRSSRNQSGGFYDVEEIHKRLREKYNVQFVSFQDNLITIEDSTLSEETKKDIVLDMANEHIAVYYFTQANLRAMAPSDKGGYGYGYQPYTYDPYEQGPGDGYAPDPGQDPGQGPGDGQGLMFV